MRRKETLKKREGLEGLGRSKNDKAISAHIKSSVTNCDHSKYGVGVSETEQKVLETLKTFDYPVTPKVLALHSRVKHNSIRKVLKRLVEKGFVTRAYYGHYAQRVTKDRVGGGVALRVHKLIFVVRCEPLGTFGSRVLVNNDLFKVAVNGFSNGVVVYVDCKGSYSFDYGAFLALVELVKRELGVSERDIEVRSFELNSDLLGVQLDGVKAVTLKDFTGAFQRFYNKNSRVLRKEANIQTPLPLESAFLLLNGGITPFQVFQANYQLIQEAKGLVEAVKFGNRTQAEVHRLLKEILEKLLRDPGSRPGNCEAHSGECETHG